MSPGGQPKVAIVCNTFSASFVFRQTLIQQLLAEDRLAAVASLSDDSAKIQDWASDAPHCVIAPGLGGLRRAAKTLRAAGTGLCHGFTHAGNMVALALGLMLWVPVVMNVTGMGRAFSSTGLRYRVLRVALLGFYFLAQFLVRYVIVQNKDDAALFARIFLPWMRRKILRTNGSGIAPDFFQGVTPAEIGGPETKIRVGFFSRALPEKGVLEFYALARSYQDRPDIGFFHIGHAGVGDFAPDAIQAHAAASNVSYLSFQPDPRQFQLAMDIVVLPSNYREGFSRLSIEAMLAGKVVVAQETTGVRDHLHTAQNGFLYRGAEALPAAFSQALSQDPASIGAAAKAYALAHFDVADVDRVYLKAYQEPGSS